MMTITQKKLLGESLVEKGLITAEQLKEAELLARANTEPLRKILTKKGYLSEKDLAAFLSEEFDLPFIEFIGFKVQICS